MNEFITQFLIESREFVEQATEGLLVLEKSPYDAEKLDSVFRAFHTLKGGAGIVEFTAMERAVHAAEEILSSARSGKRALTTALVGDCLACLDQVIQWLDVLEQTGEFPSLPEKAADKTWLADTLERNPAVSARAATALRFIPDPDCFFHGEDPLARITALPELLALDIQPVAAWPSLNSFDPYKCNLVLTALTAASRSEVTAHMRGHSGTCEMRDIHPAQSAPLVSELPSQARDILRAQQAMLGHATAANLAGFVASAGRTAHNVLRSCALADAADLVSQATEQSLGENSSEPLRIAIAQLLSPNPPVRPEPSKLPGKPEAAVQTLRIDARRIDALVRLTGELTVAKNAAGHVAKLAQEEGNALAGILKERQAVLDRLISELQESVLGMRVLPLRTVLQRFPRVVREMSVSLGKPLTLEVEGDDTEADKAIVEMLFEPLLHIVRNAVDHGIESPSERAARGKPPTAQIRIRAARQADQVIIEISDDGRGIDLARVRDVAQTRGVASEAELREMSDIEIINLVFAAGFSTAAKVTELSGRGVGLDAVRTAVERVGGRVSVESRAGLGATVRFSLPFSVMMTQVMTVEAGGQTFGVPLDAIVETVSVPRTAIMGIGAAHAIVLRNRTVPVVDLANVLGLRESVLDETDAIVVITALAGHVGGLKVDRIGQRLEVILKPLDGLLSGMPGITGTTLLGDGRVLLVLDIGELLQ
jgi:two-component system, chemotaxis family, sensor kinase CheA